MSVLFPSVGDVWARTVCRRRTWTLLCSRGLCFTVTRRRMTTVLSCKCSQTAAARSVWSRHSLPVDIFLLLNYKTAWLQKANKKDISNAYYFCLFFFSQVQSSAQIGVFKLSVFSFLVFQFRFLTQLWIPYHSLTAHNHTGREFLVAGTQA